MMYKCDNCGKEVNDAHTLNNGKNACSEDCRDILLKEVAIFELNENCTCPKDSESELCIKHGSNPELYQN